MNILLVCGAGASTSYLEMKMLEEAKLQGKNYTIKAVAISELTNNISIVDVILLGPQITYSLGKIEEMAEPLGIPVSVIRPQDYGMVDAPKILSFAEDLVTKHKNQKGD